MITINQEVQVNYHYPVVFTEDVFNPENPALAQVLRGKQRKRSPKVVAVLDENVHRLQPSLINRIKSYALAHQFELARKPLVVGGGEAVKGKQAVLDAIYQLVVDERIDRHSYILAIGGGAVLDAVGYAAATAHRGIRLIRMPTTVLSQNDAGIGVKNGVNHLGRKNFLGCFTPPHAVINDYRLLETLEARDRRAGMAEAVKVALIRDRDFFEELYEQRFALARFEAEPMQRMIFRCAELHLNHIRNSGDPFEMGSARPLDFGHWSAHKLEAMSGYRIRHGEAVAIGLALDSLYSFKRRMINERDFERIWTLLSDLGFELSCPELTEMDVLASLEEFREHLGGFLSITLLTGLGSAVEVNEIDATAMKSCVAAITDRHARKLAQHQ
jgi:3-dehydroquinate synthase